MENKKENFLLPLLSLFWVILSVNYDFSLLLLGGTLLLLIFNFMKNKSIKLSKKLFNLTVILFFAYYVLISIISIVISSSDSRMSGFFNLSFSILVVIIVSLSIPKNSKSLDKSLILFRNIGILLCMIGVIEFILKENPFYDFIKIDFKDWQILDFGTFKYRITSIFLHPIVYGVFINFFFWCVEIYPIKNTFLNYFSKIIIILNAVFTQTRNCLIALIISYILYFLYYKKYKSLLKRFSKTTKGRLIAKISMLIILIILVVVMWDTILTSIDNLQNRFFQSFDNDYSFIQRTGAIKNIIGSIGDNIFLGLFGRGAGGAELFMKENPVTAGFTVVDNQYFTYLLEVGIIGTIVFIYMIFSTIIKGLKLNTNYSKVSTFTLIACSISIFFFEGMSWNVILYLFFMCLFYINSYTENKVDKAVTNKIYERKTK